MAEVWQLALQVVKGRWFSLFASNMIMIGGGINYLFPTYSIDIKSSLGYDQETLNLLDFFKELGGNFGIVSGVLAELAPPWFSLLIGAAMNFLGYFMIWLAVTNKIPLPELWHMCFYIFVAANAQFFATTCAYVTCLKNFPESRGVLLGVLKSLVGLSGAITTQLYLAIYGNNSSSIIFLIACFPSALYLFFASAIRENKGERQPNELRVFYQFLSVSVVLALFLMGMVIVQKRVNFSSIGYRVTATMICVILFSPVLIVVREEWFQMNNTRQDPLRLQSDALIERLPEIGPEEDNPKELKQKAKRSCFLSISMCDKPDRGKDYTVLQALLSMDMLILLCVTVCGFCTTCTATDNLGQIGESLGYPTNTISYLVSLVSIWSCFGRIFSGYVSEILLMRYRMPRPFLWTFVLLLSCVGNLFVAFPFSGSVYIASVIMGFSLGAQWPLLYAVISELFGLKRFATLINSVQMASPLGSYILNVKITGALYDYEALKQLAEKGIEKSSVKELTCLGVRCYRLSFITLTCTAFVGALLALVLAIRTRQFYEGAMYSRLKTEDGD
ncbi:hypothetical protein K2173_016692 [Erythroxylum novogranatense]|uniref:Nodulin-like domain-containing protein n=1 Tax=Erythroxylum novogranatense TaxID=1862640 RepID=A0AAV8SHG6_9ROSI|nr:hypothetical protein K2173_016692 [Erythroxylum novogranatense]